MARSYEVTGMDLFGVHPEYRTAVFVVAELAPHERLNEAQLRRAAAVTQARHFRLRAAVHVHDGAVFSASWVDQAADASRIAVISAEYDPTTTPQPWQPLAQKRACDFFTFEEGYMFKVFHYVPRAAGASADAPDVALVVPGEGSGAVTAPSVGDEGGGVEAKAEGPTSAPESGPPSGPASAPESGPPSGPTSAPESGPPSGPLSAPVSSAPASAASHILAVVIDHACVDGRGGMRVLHELLEALVSDAEAPCAAEEREVLFLRDRLPALSCVESCVIPPLMRHVFVPQELTASTQFIPLSPREAVPAGSHARGKVDLVTVADVVGRLRAEARAWTVTLGAVFTAALQLASAVAAVAQEKLVVADAGRVAWMGPCMVIWDARPRVRPPLSVEDEIGNCTIMLADDGSAPCWDDSLWSLARRTRRSLARTEAGDLMLKTRAIQCSGVVSAHADVCSRLGIKAGSMGYTEMSSAGPWPFPTLYAPRDKDAAAPAGAAKDADAPPRALAGAVDPIALRNVCFCATNQKRCIAIAAFISSFKDSLSTVFNLNQALLAPDTIATVHRTWRALLTDPELRKLPLHSLIRAL
jgi:hypothetical protein